MYVNGLLKKEANRDFKKDTIHLSVVNLIYLTYMYYDPTSFSLYCSPSLFIYIYIYIYIYKFCPSDI